MKLLKEFIREVCMSTNIQDGAGIIVVRKFGDEYKVLSLRNHKGILDIPKGGIEPDEFPLEAALRETLEESGISKLDFVWGLDYIINEQLTCYVAETSQDPIISRNPHTGIMEHASASWVSWEELIQGTFDYVVPCVEWAKRRVVSI